jgi:hypothetical protein
MKLPRSIATIPFRQTISRVLLPAGVLFAFACGSAQAAAGETLAQIKARGTLRCGVPITVCQLAMAAVYVLVLFRLG